MSGAALAGTGSCVPDTIRGNDDPVFSWLHEHHPAGQDLFQGYDQRRVLVGSESVVDLMVPAARLALERAGRTVVDVDLILGYASVGRWEMPNDLAEVARRLGVSPATPILPVNNEYANFNAGIVLADAMIAAGRARCALVVVGCDWSRYVDYHTPPAVSAADGAGAAVMVRSETGEEARFCVVGHAVEYDYAYLGGMYVAADPVPPAADPPRYGPPVFHLTELGLKGFTAFGVHRPPAVVAEVLTSHGASASDVAFVGHQTSLVLNQAWQAVLQPAQFVETLASLANMTLASIPVNLDRCYDDLEPPLVALVALGPEVSCNVVLLGPVAPDADPSSRAASQFRALRRAPHAR
jgi:3-oxoacyl-[acyl-carrier-protein] synthase-3